MPARAIDLAFRRRLKALRDVVARRVDRIYGAAFDVTDVDAALAQIAPQLAELLEGSQETAAAYAVSYLGALLDDEPPDVPPPAGTTSRGEPLLAGMAAWPAMIKAQIGLGRPAEEVASYARYLGTRFVDSETTAAADDVMAAIADKSDRLNRWEGIVSAGACDQCVSQNVGEHDLSEELYRHAGCGCIKQWVADPA